MLAHAHELRAFHREDMGDDYGHPPWRGGGRDEGREGIRNACQRCLLCDTLAFPGRRRVSTTIKVSSPRSQSPPKRDQRPASPLDQSRRWEVDDADNDEEMTREEEGWTEGRGKDTDDRPV